MPSMPFMSSLFPPNYSLKASSSRPTQPSQQRPELHPLQKRVDDPEPSFSDLVMALPLPPSMPNSNASSPTSAVFQNSAAMKSAPLLHINGSRSRTPSGSGSRRPSPPDHDLVVPKTVAPGPRPSLSKARSGSDLRGAAAFQRTSSLTPRPRSRSGALRSTRPSTPTRRDTATFESCMESGIAYESQSQSHDNQGEVAARHLRLASTLFGQALAMRPASAWARLRRATILLQMARLEDPPTSITLATAQLQEARTDLLHLTRTTPSSMTVRQTLASVSKELSKIYLATDDRADNIVAMWEGQPGRLACEALESMEEAAAERMDRVSQLSKEDFGYQTPSLANMFLQLAEAAGTAAMMAYDSDSVDDLAELADKALDQATNMVGIATVMLPSSDGVTELITRVQLASGRTTINRLRHLSLLGAPFHEEDFAGTIKDVSLLVEETRARATTSDSVRAASQASECARLLADTLWLAANLMRSGWNGVEWPSSPSSASVATTTSLPCAAQAQPTPEGYIYSRSRAGSVGPSSHRSNSDGSLPPPALDRSRQSSTTSVGSLESPPIVEEVIVEEQELSPSYNAGGGTTSASRYVAKSLPAKKLPEPAQTPKGRRRPPPLQLSLPPPICPLPPVPSPLSPLNPARRASESRPRIPRQFSGSLTPRRASSGSQRRLSANAGASSPLEMPPIPQRRPAPMPQAQAQTLSQLKSLDLARKAMEHLDTAEGLYKQALSYLPDTHARDRAEVLLQLSAVYLFKANVPRQLLQALGTERRGSYLIAAEVYAGKALEALNALAKEKDRDTPSPPAVAAGRVSPSSAGAAEWLEWAPERLASVHWTAHAVAKRALLHLLDVFNCAGKEAEVVRLLKRMRGRVTPGDVRRHVVHVGGGSAFWTRVREAL